MLTPFYTADFFLRHRGVVKFFLHVGIFTAAYLAAWLLRFEFRIPEAYLHVVLWTLPLLVALKVLSFAALGVFRGWWRYVSIRDILPIGAACTASSLAFAAVKVFLLPGFAVPRSIYVIDWGIGLMMILAGRYVVRAGRESAGRANRPPDRKVLIVGAGSAGRMIAREIRVNAALGMIEVGFIDDDPDKIGTRIEGLRVLGGHERIDEICRSHGVDEIIIAMPSAPPRAVRHIVEHCREVSARFRILPGVGEIIDGKVSVKALRNVNLEDLLGREPVALDANLLRRDITGRVVMVTGAAGSIGSELCRQVAGLGPSRLVLFEIAESPLFYLEHDLKARFPALSVAPVIGDIRDRRRVEEAIVAHKPAVIYHAAAYKHVPMMEIHPVEAVKTNVLGTLIVAETAARLGVGRFVLVSSDKAVRPANVMGATKRVAELIVRGLSRDGEGTVFVAVRFGNVLDSAGSVIPIFRRQLGTTGKLTVTHPEASRYFMLIPEAAGLILQAGAMGEGGEVFVLDMGEPVSIVDLAKNMIRLSGKELGVDAEIVYTGLRPGEKLREELVVEGEDVVRTSHPKVMKMIGNGPPSSEWLGHRERLVDLAVLGDRAGVVRELKSLVKGYSPDVAFHAAAYPPDAASRDDAAAFPPPLSPPSKSIH